MAALCTPFSSLCAPQAATSAARRSPFSSSSHTAAPSSSHAAPHRPFGGTCSSRRGPLACRAILSAGPQRSSSGACESPLPGAAAPPVVSARDAVVTHASDASEAVPLPEPEGVQPPRLPDASWLNALVDNTVKVPYRAYASALKSRPLLTKALTSLVGFVLGDLIAQHFSHPGAVDVLRAARLGAYGLMIDGPVGALWYDALEARVPGNSTRAVLAKTALDQIVYATIMTVVYFAVIRSLEGHPELIAPTLSSKFVPTLAANYAIWPLAHLVNFRFVPADYRILYNNVVCVAWLTYLSLLTHTKINLLSLLHLTH